MESGKKYQIAKLPTNRTDTFYIQTLSVPEWKIKEELSVELKGLNLDAVWESIIIQIGCITMQQGNTLEKQLAVDEQRMKIEREIAKLEKQARAERQPKKKFEIVMKIKKIKEELEVLNNG